MVPSLPPQLEFPGLWFKPMSAVHQHNGKRMSEGIYSKCSIIYAFIITKHTMKNIGTS
jgi:hypothetical protein